MADLTRILTGEGVLWLASIRDAFSNRIVGWATDTRADTDLVLAALDYALFAVRCAQASWCTTGTRAAQYTALRFTQRLADAGIAPSTGSIGDSFDNALAENLWSTIKIEMVYWPGTTFATRAEAETALFRYIDGWYNPRRIQEGLGGLSPDEYEDLPSRPARPRQVKTRLRGAAKRGKQSGPGRWCGRRSAPWLAWCPRTAASDPVQRGQVCEGGREYAGSADGGKADRFPKMFFAPAVPHPLLVSTWTCGSWRPIRRTARSSAEAGKTCWARKPSACSRTPG